MVVLWSIYKLKNRNKDVPPLTMNEEILLWWGSCDRSSEEEDMRLRLVSHVVDPALALLNTQVPPLLLRHEVCPGNHLGQIFGQHHVPVLELVVVVLVGVVDVLARHLESRRRRHKAMIRTRKRPTTITILSRLKRRLLLKSIRQI